MKPNPFEPYGIRQFFDVAGYISNRHPDSPMFVIVMFNVKPKRRNRWSHWFLIASEWLDQRITKWV